MNAEQIRLETIRKIQERLQQIGQERDALELLLRQLEINLTGVDAGYNPGLEPKSNTAIFLDLLKQHGPLRVPEIWRLARVRGVKINSDNPQNVVRSTLRDLAKHSNPKVRQEDGVFTWIGDTISPNEMMHL